MDGVVLDRERRPAADRRLDVAVTGMHCASCVRRVEQTLAALPGVADVSVNLATERASITPAPGFDPARVGQALAATGFPAAAGEIERLSGAAAGPLRPRKSTEGATAVLALAFAAPLLLPMVAAPFGLHVMLPGRVQLLLAALVQFGFGARFYRGAWQALRGGTGTMDTLVALGTSAAFGLSLWNLRQGGPLYFEAAAAVIALVRLGKWLEGRARQQAASAINALDTLRPEQARVRRDGRDRDIPLAELVVGDLLLVRPGERIAADGIVREGRGSADESLLTGESLPVPKQPGDRLIAGALNGEGTLLSQVTAVGGQTQLAQIARLVADAQAGKPPVQRLVDRVSAVFVPAVIAVAVLTLLGWVLAGAGVEAAVVNAVAVLVIACPCALGLATPAAIMVGTGVAARHGILIRDAAVLERAEGIRTVVFDKTGTLTSGQPQLLTIEPAFGQTTETVLRLAAALSAGSEHPLARAVISRAGAPAAAAAGVRALPGSGVEGHIGERLVSLGNARLMRESGVDLHPFAPLAQRLEGEGRTLSYLAEGGRLIGLLGFGDAIKPGASQAVAALRARGICVVLLTGDSQGAADVAARALGIDDVRAGARPADKAAMVTSLRREGAVAMVGDGVNDAAALAGADLGLAMATGTDVAAAASGITLMRSDPALVPAALDIAARTVRRIRQGLAWAFAYNLVAIPLAAAGLLSPTLAGAAMALSSVSVVASALLLRRWRPAALA